MIDDNILPSHSVSTCGPAHTVRPCAREEDKWLYLRNEVEEAHGEEESQQMCRAEARIKDGSPNTQFCILPIRSSSFHQCMATFPLEAAPTNA